MLARHTAVARMVVVGVGELSGRALELLCRASCATMSSDELAIRRFAYRNSSLNRRWRKPMYM